MDREPPMRFFLEESSFVLPNGALAPALEGHIERLIELVRGRHAHEDVVFRWSRLEETEIRPGMLLLDLLYGASSPIERDTRVALQQVINRCVQWDDVIDPVPAPNIEIDGLACDAPTVAVVHARISVGEGAACLTLGVRPERAKVCLVRAGATSLEVHFVPANAQLPAFYRTLFELEDMRPDAYMENALDAFPDIGFVSGLASHFGRFETKYRDVRPTVTAHLGALNDHFRTLFRKHGGKPSETSRELCALCGVDASPESPKTRNNKKAMGERDVAVSEVHVGGRRLHVGRTVSCEWHTKIRPTADRIHFHPGAGGVAEGRIIVGLFAHHLTT